MQWTIANPVGADRSAKRQKKRSCVATGRPVYLLKLKPVNLSNNTGYTENFRKYVYLLKINRFHIFTVTYTFVFFHD